MPNLEIHQSQILSPAIHFSLLEMWHERTRNQSKNTHKWGDWWRVFSRRCIWRNKNQKSSEEDEERRNKNQKSSEGDKEELLSGTEKSTKDVNRSNIFHNFFINLLVKWKINYLLCKSVFTRTKPRFWFVTTYTENH